MLKRKFYCLKLCTDSENFKSSFVYLKTYKILKQSTAFKIHK